MQVFKEYPARLKVAGKSVEKTSKFPPYLTIGDIKTKCRVSWNLKESGINPFLTGVSQCLDTLKLYHQTTLQGEKELKNDQKTIADYGLPQNLNLLIRRFGNFRDASLVSIVTLLICRTSRRSISSFPGRSLEGISFIFGWFGWVGLGIIIIIIIIIIIVIVVFIIIIISLVSIIIILSNSKMSLGGLGFGDRGYKKLEKNFEESLSQLRDENSKVFPN
jgi:hypothetical protein